MHGLLNIMKLNPLIKIENLEQNKCLVSLLIDRRKFQVNRDLFMLLLDSYNNNLTRENIELHIADNLKVNKEEVSSFINNLFDKKILLHNTDGYPVDQINHWVKRKWLNALIYHLESQNVECIDDGNSIDEDKKDYFFDNKELHNIWKIYSDLPTGVLPSPNLSVFEERSLEEVLLKRDSFLPFKGKSILLNDLSNIFAAANTELVNNRLNLEKNTKSLYKSSFSALETYIFIFDVEKLDKGLYHYDPKNHNLILLKKGDFEEIVTDMCIGQKRASMGGCLFLITANSTRYMARYKHERAYRNMLVNVAEFAHQYIFYSTALDYSTFLTPAIKDELASNLLNIDGFKEIPLYTVAIG